MDNLSFATKGVTINNGKADEVATPMQICNDMIDLFPKEAFSNPRKIWADLYCKTGNTLMALKRHGVPKENIIAICTTPQSQLFACRQLYGKLLEEVEIDLKKYPEVTGVVSITRRGNVYYISKWKDIVLGKISNTHAFEIINKIILKETRSEMQLEWDSDKEFTINNIIMNPPYNKGMDLDFVNLAFKIATDNVVAITPAKWQTGSTDKSLVSKTINYEEFRQQLVPYMSYVCFYPNALDVFDIRGNTGITYFLMDKKKHDECLVENRFSCFPEYYNTVESRDISNGNTLCNTGNQIIKYIPNTTFSYVRKKVSDKKWVVWGTSAMPMFLDFKPNSKEQHYMTSDLKLAPSAGLELSSDSFIFFESDDKSECESFISYLYTKLVRFLISCAIGTYKAWNKNETFRFVPAPPSGKFDHIYTDQELYKAFNLPQKYIDVIEAVIKERK